MCSICGGTKWNGFAVDLWEESKDRGRDAHGKMSQRGAWIGNHRGTPTTEAMYPTESQPVGNNPWFVFNGTIANDKSLGIKEGEADTSVLPRILDPKNLMSFWSGIKKIVGSYAIASLDNEGKILLANNYKPIWIAEVDGEYFFSSLKQHFPSWCHPWRMEPYSVRGLTGAGGSMPVMRKQRNDKAIVICSSGLDSTAVAAYAVQHHEEVVLIHFDYGCLASKKEQDRIEKIAHELSCEWHVLPIPKMFFGEDSAIMKEGEEISKGIEGAEYAHEWVPARNLVMLSLTTAYAEAYKFGHIYLGTNLEEAGAFPDNEEQFVLDFNSLLYGAVQNGVKIEVHTPLGGLMKHEVVTFGNKYKAPFELTWSCYRDGEKHCGECAPCFMRKTAFERNGLVDPVFE
jgi:7-cyano-7-deazaguanine synthase